MDAFSQIRKIMSESEQQNKAQENADSTESIQEGDPVSSTPKEMGKSVGYDENRKAQNATSANQAKKPQDDPKAKNSSSSTSKATEVSNSAKVTHEEKEEKDDKKSGKKLPFFMKKGKKKDDDDSDESDDKDSEKSDKDSDDEDDSDDMKMKGKGKGKDKCNEEQMTVEEVGSDISGHLDALLSGEPLSEEFKAKAKTIFEAVIAEKENQLREAICEEYEQVVAEHVEQVKSELTEQLDVYLDYVAEQWLEENRLEVEAGLKNEITESFLTGLHALFMEHNISVPESKVDIVEELSNKVDELEAKLSDEMNANIELSQELEQYAKMEIVGQVAEGLSSVQADKLLQLSEDISFEDADKFKSKVETIKESYFNKNRKPTNTKVLTEDAKKLVESNKTTVDDFDQSGEDTDKIITEEVSAEMQVYLDALSNMNAKRAN